MTLAITGNKFAKMKLRWYQQEAIQSIFDYYETGNTGNPVIALPTGTGKSLIIAGFIQRVLMMWPRQRFMVLTHVKELIEQNHDKLLAAWETAPAGIFSAGLNRKDVASPIIFGGCASVVKRIESFGHRDLLIIDEAHLLSPKDGTTYRKIIDALTAINPHLKVIGLTATPYRLGQGMLTDDGIFTDIVYDMTGIEGFQRLIAEQYLSPPVPKRTDIELDTTGVTLGSNGDYRLNQLQEAVDKKDVTTRALSEMLQFGKDRKSWLVFASGIEHAEHINEMLNTAGIRSAVVHSKMDGNRKQILDDFKSGKIRCVVNNNVLTTGFDHPQIDLIGMLRPTVSPGLWVQMLGRGTRPCEGKSNCLVLDFAGNTKRLGPINDPMKPKKKGKRTGEAPVKICEACGVYNHASVRVCDFCGHPFPIRSKITKTAAFEELIRGEELKLEWFTVDTVIYTRHTKIGKPDSMKVTYVSGLRQFHEWVCAEHGGFASKKARDWFRKRCELDVPITTSEMLSRSPYYRKPKKIKVWLKAKNPEILTEEF